MKVSNPRRFRARVQIPVSALLCALGVYSTLFMNIYLYGQPVTLVVSGALLIGALVVESYEPQNVNNQVASATITPVDSLVWYNNPQQPNTESK